MRKLLIGAAMASALASAPALAQGINADQMECAEYLTAVRSGEAGRELLMDWFARYMEGAGVYTADAATRWGDHAPYRGMLWLEEWCGRNTVEPISKGAGQLAARWRYGRG